jgi:hypothetical protein
MKPVVIRVAQERLASDNRSAHLGTGTSACTRYAGKEIRFYMDGVMRCVGTSAPYQCQITLARQEKLDTPRR